MRQVSKTHSTFLSAPHFKHVLLGGRTFFFSKFVVATRPLALGALLPTPELLEEQSQPPTSEAEPLGASGVTNAVLLSGLAAKKGSAFPYVWATRYWEIFASREVHLPTISPLCCCSNCSPRGWSHALTRLQMLYYNCKADASAGEPPRGRRHLCAMSKPDGRAMHFRLENGKSMILRLSTEADRDQWYSVLSALLGSGTDSNAVSAEL